MTTLVLCVDRSNDIGRTAGVPLPVDGWEAVRSLVTEVGLADPEDSSVNCLLEGLRVTRELRAEGDEAVVAVVAGDGDGAVGPDRSVAAQLDDLLDRHDLDSAVVVIDSAQDERVVPVVESRLPIDSVDRVVVRQARDIESTYYLLKQFLADEELRSTVLVPVGVALVSLPLLLAQFPTGLSVALLAALFGAALLYKGLAVDERLSNLSERTREALYAGQVSVVTYVVAGGLTLIAASLGALSVQNSPGSTAVVAAVAFVHRAVPWLALAALTASAGRLLDELLRDEGVRTPYLNLPFAAVALGLAVRGVTGSLLVRESVMTTPDLVVGPWTLSPTPNQHLAAFVVGAVAVSLASVGVTASVSDERLDEVIEREREREHER